MLNIIKQLSLQHKVILASLTASQAEEQYLHLLRPYCSEIHLVEHRRTPLRRALEITASPIQHDPYLVSIYRSPKMAELVARLSKQVDVVQAEFPYGGQYLNNLDVPTVLDEHNVESDVARLNCQYERNIAKKLFLHLQSKKMKAFEAALCRSVSLILATSQDDRNALSKYNPKTEVIPNGVHLREPVQRFDPGTVLFTGLMSYTANIDAMTYFCRDIWPRVEASPKRHLTIVGKKPTRGITLLAGPEITVTGEVPDVEPFLNRTAVFVAPLRIGSGTRIKILEAMAHGLPVVSTSIGAMGLDVTDGKNIFIANTPDEFASRVNFLLANHQERARLGMAGYDLVKARYTWDAIGGLLERAYTQWESVLLQQ